MSRVTDEKTTKQVIPVPGMHCRSCEISLTDELEKLSGVRAVSASAKRKRVEITVAVDDEPSDIEIAQAVKRAGYEVGGDGLPVISHTPAVYTSIAAGVVVGAIVMILLNRLGLETNIGEGNLNDSVWLPLLIGGLAGVSTCMALVGGLVAGLGAKYAAQHPNATKLQKFEPHLFFNAGRIVGFIILGGILGLLGSAFTPTPAVLGVLTIIAALLMLIVGLQLTGLFPRLTAFTLPPSLSRKLGLNKVRNKDYSHKGAVTLGVLSFFLPCGFTQAMQLTAAASGSWVAGALTMGLFAVGTAPGLLFIGGITSFIKGRRSAILLGIIGTVIVMFAVSNVFAGSRMLGFEPKLPEVTSSKEADDDSVINVTYLGRNNFNKKEIRIKTGKDYTLKIYSDRNEYGCMSTVMVPSISSARPQLIKAGKTIYIPLNAQTPGETSVMCAMGAPFNLTIIAE